jgi:FAD binding domain
MSINSKLLTAAATLTVIGGVSTAGTLSASAAEGAMLLKTSRMRRVDIYPATRSARAEAGAQWQDVIVPAGEHGLAALAGSSQNIGVTGYTLGGGISWPARRYGLAANSVSAVEIVTPDGRLARADADHEPDLFWGVKGAGGSLRVVSPCECLGTAKLLTFRSGQGHASHGRLRPEHRAGPGRHGKSEPRTAPAGLTSATGQPRNGRPLLN